MKNEFTLIILKMSKIVDKSIPTIDSKTQHLQK